jgi:hypothetical protein
MDCDQRPAGEDERRGVGPGGAGEVLGSVTTASRLAMPTAMRQDSTTRTVT